MNSPLIDRLSQRFGYPVLDASTLDAFLDHDGASVLFFSGDPAKYPEADDVAVILPELMARFAGRARAAVIARAAEMELQPRFGFLQWPALAVCDRHRCRGTISRVRDWSEYLEEFERLLPAGARRIALTDLTGSA
jgi:hydrogenase-1 operon protein HyaE